MSQYVRVTKRAEPYTCKHCARLFDQRADLRIHLWKEHRIAKAKRP